MKRLIKIAAVVLAIGLILTGVGIFLTRRDNVNPGSVYSIVEENLKLGESSFEYTEPKPRDISGVQGVSDSTTAEYGLNEFNTLCIYTESCDVYFLATRMEAMTVNLFSGELKSAIVNGTLYIQAIGDQPMTELSIGVPEIYKGAFQIDSKNSIFELEEVESAMDITMNLCDSRLSADKITGDSLTLSMSRSTFSADTLAVTESIHAQGESSEIVTKSTSAPYSSFTFDGGSSDIGGITGSFSIDAQRHTTNLNFSAVNGNIALNLTAASADVTVPSGAPLEQHHTEQYSVFKDKTKPAQNDPSILGGHYTMETNIKFGIVTVGN